MHRSENVAFLSVLDYLICSLIEMINMSMVQSHEGVEEFSGRLLLSIAEVLDRLFR
jgi:hypothetical protein